jgi:hypothetical protein
MGITPDKVWELLGKLGIDKGSPDAEALLDADTTQEGDARTVFVENGGPVKVVRFKLGWAILKGKKSTTTGSGETGGTLGNLIEMLRPVGKMSNEELLAKYGQSCPSEILEELGKRSKGRPVFVFEGEAILVPTTLTLLTIAQTRETPATFKVGDKDYRTYRVGEFPQAFVEECPIHGEVILAGGYCEKCMQDWSKVDNDTRVSVRVAVTMGAVAIDNLAQTSWIFEKAAAGLSTILKIAGVQLRYNELAEEQKLPILKRKFSSQRSGRSDPFFVSRY